MDRMPQQFFAMPDAGGWRYYALANPGACFRVGAVDEVLHFQLVDKRTTEHRSIDPIVDGTMLPEFSLGKTLSVDKVRRMLEIAEQGSEELVYRR